MIIMEGTPGAGKTTMLGALLAEHPTALIFPEAQPLPNAQHPHDLQVLLAEDHHRTRCAAGIQARFPDALVASDRCHLGVLAYRYALSATGRARRAVFEQARELAQRLGLDARHHHDEIHISVLDPQRSRRHRARFATEARYQVWFDLEFLTAYNDFFHHLDRWSTPGPHWITTPLPDRIPPRAPATALRCPWACTEVRSPIIAHGQTQRQLYTDALHHRPTPDAPVACLRNAQQVTAAWHADLGHHPTRRHTR